MTELLNNINNSVAPPNVGITVKQRSVGPPTPTPSDSQLSPRFSGAPQLSAMSVASPLPHPQSPAPQLSPGQPIRPPFSPVSAPTQSYPSPSPSYNQHRMSPHFVASPAPGSCFRGFPFVTPFNPCSFALQDPRLDRKAPGQIHL